SAPIIAHLKQLWTNVRQGNYGDSKLQGKDLYSMLVWLPPTAKRDQLILNISGAAFVEMEGADIASILCLLSKGEYGRIPEEAWYRMGREDMERIIRSYPHADETR